MSFTLDQNSWPCQRAINNSNNRTSTCQDLAGDGWGKKRGDSGGGGVGGRRGGQAYAEAMWNHGKRSRHLDWKCKMFSGVTLSGFIIGVLSYERSDNVTCT